MSFYPWTGENRVKYHKRNRERISKCSRRIVGRGKSALGDFKDNILGFFGIHSPSRWGEYVGNMIDQGIANGISGDAKLVTDSANLVKKLHMTH